LKKHQKEYRAYVSTQTNNNNKRDEIAHTVQVHIKRLEKHYQLLTDELNKRFSGGERDEAGGGVGGEKKLSHAFGDESASIVHLLDYPQNTPSTAAITEATPSSNIQERPSPSRPVSPLRRETGVSKTGTPRDLHKESGRRQREEEEVVAYDETHHSKQRHSANEHHSTPPHHSSKQKKHSSKTHKGKKATRAHTDSADHHSPPATSSHPTQHQKGDDQSLRRNRSMSEEEDSNSHHLGDHLISHTSSRMEGFDDHELQTRVCHTEYEIARINDTMEVILHGFKELGNRLAQTVSGVTAGIGPSAGIGSVAQKMSVAAPNILSPNVTMPLSITLNQPPLHQAPHVRSQREQEDEKSSPSVAAAPLLHASMSPDSMSTEERSFPLQESSLVQSDQQVLPSQEEDTSSLSSPPLTHFHEKSRLVSLIPQSDQRALVSSQDHVITQSYQPLSASISTHQHPGVEGRALEEVHHIIEALASIGKIGTELLTPQDSSSPTGESITPSDSLASLRSSPRASNSRRTTHRLSLRPTPYQPTSSVIDSSVLLPLTMGLKDQEVKSLDLENKFKQLDDHYRQLKLQFVSLQETTKGLKAAVNSSNSSGGGSGNGGGGSTKRSYKSQVSSGGGKHEKAVGDGETPDWSAPLEELKTKLQELRSSLDELLLTESKHSSTPTHSSSSALTQPTRKEFYSSVPHGAVAASSGPSGVNSISGSTHLPSYHDDASLGELSVLTESMVDGHHKPTSLAIQTTVYHAGKDIHHEGGGVGDEGDLNDDLSDIHYDPSTPVIPFSLIPQLEQRILKLEKLFLDPSTVSSSTASSSSTELKRLSELEKQHETLNQATEEQEKEKVREKERTNEREKKLSSLTIELKEIKSLEEMNSQKIHDLQRYLTESVDVMTDEVSSSLPREEFDRAISGMNKEIFGIKKGAVEREWVQNKLNQKADKGDVDRWTDSLLFPYFLSLYLSLSLRLVAGITSIIGDPFQSTAAAMHKCLVCDKPVSVAIEGKPSNGYDKADDPHLSHSPIKRPGTVSGRLLNSTNSIETESNLSLPPVVVPGVCSLPSPSTLTSLTLYLCLCR
jgi:hypothetical protein